MTKRLDRIAGNLPKGHPFGPFWRALLLTFSVSTIWSPASYATFSERTWAELQRNGTDALDANKYWLAEPLLKQSIIEAEKYGCDNWRLAKSLGEVGRLYTIRGRFDLAEPYLERELRVRELAVDQDPDKLIPAMGSLIKFYLDYGTASKADQLANDMLATIEGKMREPRMREQGKNVVKEGTVIEGWLGTAAPVALTPLLEWAITCDSVGTAYRVRKNWKMAQKMFQASLDVKTIVLGSKHLSMASTYDSLGCMYLDKEDYKEAEIYFKDALEITEGILDPAESVQVYSRVDKLARALIKQKRYEEAEALYRKALAQYWKKPESASGDASRAKYALGSLYAEQRKWGPAAGMLSQALAGAQKFNGPSSVVLVPYMQRYAYVLYYLGRRGESASLKARADFISPPEPVKVAVVLKDKTVAKAPLVASSSGRSHKHLRHHGRRRRHR